MLTANDLVKQTRPREAGADDGVHDIPSSTASTYTTETEQDIQSLCQEEVSASQDAYLKTLSKSRAQISQIRATLPTDITRKASNLKSAIRKSLLEHEGDIRQAADEVESRSKDLRRFKVLNNINYEPNYDNSIVNLIGSGLLVVALESAANAYFFGRASEAGLLGGFFTAGMISIANVFIGFLTGVWPFRQMNHIKKWRLIWAVPLTFFSVLGAIVFNLIVGHYREELIKNPDAEILEVIPGAMNNLLDIRSFESMILVLVGLCIFGLSLYKGYKVWDTYPGYMSKHRAKRKAEFALKRERERINRQVDLQLGEEQNRFKEIGASLINKRASLDTIAQEISREVTTFNSKLEQIQQAGNFAMKIYRDANQQVRSRRSPPPAYFQSEFRVDGTSDLPALREAHSDLAIARDQLSVADQAFQTASIELATERTEIMSQLEQIVTTAELLAKSKAQAESDQEKSAREFVQAAKS